MRGEKKESAERRRGGRRGLKLRQGNIKKEKREKMG